MAAATEELKKLVKAARDIHFSGACGGAYIDGIDQLVDVVPVLKQLITKHKIVPFRFEEYLEPPLAVMWTKDYETIGILSENGWLIVLKGGVWEPHKIIIEE